MAVAGNPKHTPKPAANNHSATPAEISVPTKKEFNSNAGNDLAKLTENRRKQAVKQAFAASISHNRQTKATGVVLLHDRVYTAANIGSSHFQTAFSIVIDKTGKVIVKELNTPSDRITVQSTQIATPENGRAFVLVMNSDCASNLVFGDYSDEIINLRYTETAIRAEIPEEKTPTAKFETSPTLETVRACFKSSHRHELHLEHEKIEHPKDAIKIMVEHELKVEKDTRPQGDSTFQDNLRNSIIQKAQQAGQDSNRVKTHMKVILEKMPAQKPKYVLLPEKTTHDSRFNKFPLHLKQHVETQALQQKNSFLTKLKGFFINLWRELKEVLSGQKVSWTESAIQNECLKSTYRQLGQALCGASKSNNAGAQSNNSNFSPPVFQQMEITQASPAVNHAAPTLNSSPTTPRKSL